MNINQNDQVRGNFKTIVHDHFFIFGGTTIHFTMIKSMSNKIPKFYFENIILYFPNA
jgi:hypothetical protein